jgi:hypothetical protein
LVTVKNIELDHYRQLFHQRAITLKIGWYRYPLGILSGKLMADYSPLPYVAI